MSQREPTPTAGTCAQSPHTHAMMHTTHTRKTTDTLSHSKNRALPAASTTFQQHREARQHRMVGSAGKKYVDGGLLLEFDPHAHERPLLSLIVGTQGWSWSCTAHGSPYAHITRGARVVFCDRERASWIYVLKPREVQVLCSVISQKSGSIAQRCPPRLWSFVGLVTAI